MSDDNTIELPEGMDVGTARDVLREFGTTEDAQVVSEDTLESLRDEISEAKEAFAALLAEESPQSAETLSRQDMDALTEPFRDEEGEIDVDTLQQTSETGAVEVDEEAEEDDVDLDALAEETGLQFSDEHDAVETLRQRYQKYKQAGWDSMAQEDKERLETLGVEVEE